MVSFTVEKAESMSDESIKLRLTFRLSPQQASLMLLLLSMEVVASQVIYERLSVGTEVRVAVHRLRKSLETYNINIEAKRGLGYWLTSETKAKIRQILADREH